MSEDPSLPPGERPRDREDTQLPESLLPDSQYRPVPIVWFAGAMLVQTAVLAATGLLLAIAHPYAVIALASLGTGIVGQWTWSRGMKTAPAGWKLATILVLGAQLALVSLLAAARL